MRNRLLSQSRAIRSARVVTPPVNPFLSQGDLWMNTWADDDNIYTGWGDGQGPGALGFYTYCGTAVLKGDPPYFLLEDNPHDHVTNRYAPGTEETHFPGPRYEAKAGINNKPSSMLFCDGRLYFAIHSPLGDAEYGSIAYSDDYGKTWVEVPNSPWTKANNSAFRCLFFINMGKNYELNRDGYVYALGIGREWNWLPPGTVHLARVPKGQILDYRAYEYFAGTEDGNPIWSAVESEARPLDGLCTADQASAIYHEGIERYLFLTSGHGLFEAPQPWGPWAKVADILNTGSDPEWWGGYQPGLMTKGAEADSVYFTVTGQSRVIRYALYIGKIAFELESEIPTQASADVSMGSAPLKVQFHGATDASAAKNVSYRWYFGDGETSTEQNPTHVYRAPKYGSYRAMLTVTDEQGRRGFDVVEITVPRCELTLRSPEPEKPRSAGNSGLVVCYYDLPDGVGDIVPPLTARVPYKIDRAMHLNYPSSPYPTQIFATSDRADHFAAVFTGYLEAPVDGVYTFYLVSGDAAELFIGGEKVVENNGKYLMPAIEEGDELGLGVRLDHPPVQMRERAGQIALKAGRHALRLAYTRVNSRGGLRLYWEWPGVRRQLIPPANLSH